MNRRRPSENRRNAKTGGALSAVVRGGWWARVLRGCCSRACAATQARPNLPGTFGSGETLPPPVAPEPGGALAPGPVPPPPAAGALRAADPGAEADFRDAKARFDAGGRRSARTALEAFVAHHGQHAFRPAVDLMLARLALLRGDAAAAKRQLEPLVAAPPDPGTGSSARYYLGLSEVRLGKFARGRELLLPFLPAAGRGRARRRGAGGAARRARRGDRRRRRAAGGAGAVGRLLRAAGASTRRRYARARRRPSSRADVAPDAAVRAWRASAEQGLARAVLGAKAAAYLRAQGDAPGAAAIDCETAAARARRWASRRRSEAQGIGRPGAARAGGRAVGEVPAGGRGGDARRDAGRRMPAERGGARAVVGARCSFACATRAASPSARAGGGGAGPRRGGDRHPGRDRRKAAAASLAAASENGVPTLALDDAPPGATSTAFQLIHAPEARVAALARAALKLGARDFAMLGPDSAAGKRLREAFRREVTAAAAGSPATPSYAPGATSFGTVVAAIKKTPPQVVFVADGADRLELIAPALAAADLWPAPWGAPRPAAAPGQPKPRNVLLLSTATELSPRLLQNAGPLRAGRDAVARLLRRRRRRAGARFVDAYRAAYGTGPARDRGLRLRRRRRVPRRDRGRRHTRGDVLRALGAGRSRA